MKNEFSGYIDKIFAATTISALRRTVFRIFRNIGFDKTGYIHSVYGQPERFFIDQVGFPPGFAAEYEKVATQLEDPFPIFARQSAFPVIWADVRKNITHTKEHKAYIKALQALLASDGISISVSGPNNRDGYFALGISNKPIDISERNLGRLQLICQAAHNCFCALTSENNQNPARLSKRETQTLFWIAKGKSNAVIAEILGISRHTVDTICKRLFRKLGVNDRISAAVVGVGQGIVPHNASGTT